MTSRADCPSHDEFDELQDVMKQVGVPEQQMGRVLDIVMSNCRRYERLLRMYQLKLCSQDGHKDPFPRHQKLDG